MRAIDSSYYNYGQPITSRLPNKFRIDLYHNHHASRGPSHIGLICEMCGEEFDQELVAGNIVNGRYASDRKAQVQQERYYTQGRQGHMVNLSINTQGRISRNSVQTSREYREWQQGHTANLYFNKEGRISRNPIQTSQEFRERQQGYTTNPYFNKEGRTSRSPVQTSRECWGGQQGYNDYSFDAINQRRLTNCIPRPIICRFCRDKRSYRGDNDVSYYQSSYYK